MALGTQKHVIHKHLLNECKKRSNEGREEEKASASSRVTALIPPCPAFDLQVVGSDSSFLGHGRQVNAQGDGGVFQVGEGLPPTR